MMRHPSFLKQCGAYGLYKLSGKRFYSKVREGFCERIVQAGIDARSERLERFGYTLGTNLMPTPGMDAVVRELKNRGYRCCYWSNIGNRILERLLEDQRFAFMKDGIDLQLSYIATIQDFDTRHNSFNIY